MPHSLARRKLASAAAHLNARSPHAGRIPALILMTDDERLPDPVAAARRLPKGAAIVVRSRNALKRAALARDLVAVAKAHALVLLIANDGDLAAQCGADGIHLSQANGRQATHWRARYPRWFISAAAHDLRSARLVAAVDAIILSPIFATASHPGAVPLSAARANLIAQACSAPVYALGGITAQNAGLLRGFAGIAAIGALAA